MAPEKWQYAIGIDAGTHTGLAIWDCINSVFVEIRTVQIHRAMEIVLYYQSKGRIHVRVEDARLATFGRLFDAAKAQGAGSVKRDAAIWEDFLRDHNISCEMVRPDKRLSKWSKQLFAQVTKHHGTTSQHARDAAMMIYQYS